MSVSFWNENLNKLIYKGLVSNEFYHPFQE